MSSSSTTTSSISSSSTTSSSQSQQPLSDLSPNTTSPHKPADTKDPFKSLNATNEMPDTTKDQAATYVSPSDAMLSPTTKKLSEIKGRRFASAKTGQMGSRALFQKAVMQGKENSSSAKGQSS